MINLKDSVAIVTGGSSGIGFGIAQGLLECGADLSLWSRCPEKLNNAKEQLSTQFDAQILTVPCDVSIERQVIDAMQQTLEYFGKIDILVANAGIAKAKPLIDSSLEDIRKVNKVNFEGTFLCFREAARQFITQGNGGKLIAVTSTAAINGYANLSSYSASKGAVASMTRALAVELGPYNIQVNSILPGVFHTPMTGELENLELNYLPKMPANIIGLSQHIKSAAAFLAARESNYVTGITLPVDGGISIAAY